MPKKAHKKTMRRRKVKKGGFYGASGAIAPGAMEWKRGSEMGGFSLSSRGGNAIYGSGRKGRGSHKTSKVRRGGDRFATVSASFKGQGTNGLIDVSPVTTRGAVGSSTNGSFNYFGAKPGSGHSSFVKAA